MQQYHKKSGEDSFKPSITVLRCASHCFAFYQKRMLPSINVMSQILQVTFEVVTYILKIRKPIVRGRRILTAELQLQFQKKFFVNREKLFLAKDKDKQIWDKTS